MGMCRQVADSIETAKFNTFERQTDKHEYESNYLQMHAIGIIPARYASSRFPGKPLADIQGKPMIRRVYEQAQKATLLRQVYVATDDQRIFDAVKSFGGEVIMTDPSHPSGTDRCFEALQVIAGNTSGIDVVVNIQGDEPFIDPGQIDSLCRLFDVKETLIATLAKEIRTEQELFSTSVNKVVFDARQKALYFSRTPIPYQQHVDKADWIRHHAYYKHIGIYAYRVDVLGQIARLEPSALERAESLEQLRWLENGYPIHVGITAVESIAIDTPDDLSKFTNNA